MSSLERKFERLNYLIERLKDEISRGALLIVEGKRDILSLKYIGVNGNVIAIKSGRKTLQETLDEISSLNKEVILLMDFDRRGKELTERLRRFLEETKVKVNLRFWKELCELLNGDIKDVEGLAVCLENLRRKVEKRC
ncbi:MAG: toprim domain-containing protein [Candidatus Bathyarchaeia archaeon]|nr:toprim domain-containing protein [Candidatus Bathyarchaeota archaeon]